MKSIYQWILKDNQELSFARFEITPTYHATEKDLLEFYPYLRECHSVVGKYKPSKVGVDWMIEKIISIQNRNSETLDNS